MNAMAVTSVILLGIIGMEVSAVELDSDPNLVGWWRLDDGAGKVAKDSSGNSFDGAVQGNRTRPVRREGGICPDRVH